MSRLVVSLAVLALLAARPGQAWASGAQYGTEPELTISSTEREVLAAIQGRFRGRPTFSGALSQAARALAGREKVTGEGAPDPRSIRLALASACAPDPAVNLVEVSDLRERLPSRVAAAVQGLEADRVGLGVAAITDPKGRGTTVRAVVLASRRAVLLEPVPRDVATGTGAVLRGKLLGGLGAPQVVIGGPDGSPTQITPSIRGAAFEAPLSFDAPGRYLVEILGSGLRGPEVTALLVVSAGGAPLAGPETPWPGPDPADARAAEKRVLTAINHLRQRRGLPAVEWSERAGEVARKHSAEMLEMGMLAHVLPGGLPVGARLRRDRVPYRSARENLAKGETAMEAHETIEESPAHLASLLDPDASVAGVGLARGLLPSGQAIVYLSEILLQPVDDASGGNLRPETRVKEVLWKERERLGRPPLLADPTLDALALRSAREMLRADKLDLGDSPNQVLALPRKLAAVDAFVVASPADVTRSTNLADAKFRRVGVGVAIGDSPTRGAGLLWIAVVYSD